MLFKMIYYVNQFSNLSLQVAFNGVFANNECPWLWRHCKTCREAEISLQHQPVVCCDWISHESLMSAEKLILNSHYLTMQFDANGKMYIFFQTTRGSQTAWTQFSFNKERWWARHVLFPLMSDWLLTDVRYWAVSEPNQAAQMEQSILFYT